MKKVIIFGTFLVSSLMVWAQTKETIEKIESAKIALITQRLDLTPEQAEKFWPVYKEFNDKQLELRREFQQAKAGHNPRTATEQENQQLLELGMKIKERQLSLEKTYTNRFQQVITTRQLMSLRKAEEDFREMLIDRVRQQRQQRDQLRRDRMRNDDNNRRRQN